MQDINKYRIIFHIDMNCFFASCEIAEDPSLKGKPLIIARDDVFRRGIILTATYEARKYGIYTTMLVKDAIKVTMITDNNYKIAQVIPLEELYKTDFEVIEYLTEKMTNELQFQERIKFNADSI